MLCAVAVELGCVALAGLVRPASDVPTFLTYYLLTGVPYLIACWLVLARGRACGRGTTRWIWAAAIVFRLTLLPLEPSLSEDSVRYRWQGMMQDAGGDPYLATPDEERWAGLQDATWRRVTGKDKASAYGPVLEQLNLWCYRAARWLHGDPWTQVWLFKLPFALADLWAGLCLGWLLAGVGLPRSLAVIYLWSPLALTEFWIEGHNDSVAVALTILALGFTVRQRLDPALVALTLAALSKFWPALLLPFVAWPRVAGKWVVPWRGLAFSAAIVCVACWPYREGLPAVQDSLLGFAGGWRNNDSLFSILVLLTGGDTQLASGVARWSLMAVLVAVRLTRIGPVAASLAAVSSLLLLAPNCFPWYLTWMLPLLAVHPVPALLLWTLLASLAYHVVPAYEAVGEWSYDPALTASEYVPVVGWLAVAGASLLAGHEALHCTAGRWLREVRIKLARR